jgi:hypothetical protein
VIEDEMRRRAVDGYDEDTTDGAGALIRRVHRRSDALLQTFAKGRCRSSNSRVAHTGQKKTNRG